MNQISTTAGDFTGLAGDYSRHRPDYCRSVLNALLGLIDKPIGEIDFADVGAGTGIWTRMVHEKLLHSVIAIEPNHDMRMAGIADCASTTIAWHVGSAEETGLAGQSCDWITMASSFHWADFARSTQEFHRVLRPGGRFTALWNPRLIEANPLLMEIEGYLHALQPSIKRVSSGRSGLTETLSDQLLASPHFDDLVYLEGRHVIAMTPERYLGAWRSVNDLRVQLGPEKFKLFLEYVESKTAFLDEISATYLTRAWSVRRKG